MSDPESISSGIHLPAWMRSRADRNDFDGSAVSPPSHDDSFFYIRYPIKNTDRTDGFTVPTDLSNLTTIVQADVKNNNKLPSTKPDYSKHTEPCRMFLSAKESVNTPVDGVKNPPKPFGVDDGFKGASAACGSSIVRVAQQMVSSGRSISNRGFKVASVGHPEIDSEPAFHTKTIEDQQTQSVRPNPANYADDAEALRIAQQSARHMIRRGSKSLPASPITSPKSMRKFQPNPYFTGTFAVSGAGAVGTESRASWFISSLLGIQREASSTASIAHIEEESEENTYADQSPNSVAQTSTISHSKILTESTQDLTTQKVLKAKPSELREMNFWSPTSM